MIIRFLNTLTQTVFSFGRFDSVIFDWFNDFGLVFS